MEIKNKLIITSVCILLGVMIGFLIEPHVEVTSKKYHLYLNCKDRNIKLLIPTEEENSFEKILNGYSTITNIEIVIKGKKFLMEPKKP